MSDTKPKRALKGWDTLQATFYWRIKLDPDYRGPRPNTAEYIMGYSKRIGESEAVDKVSMLKRKIVTIWCQNGYYLRSLQMEIFQRTNQFIDHQLDQKIIVLYPDGYNIPEMAHDKVFKVMGPFLEDVKLCIRDGRDATLLLIKSRKVVSLDVYLDPTRFHFRNVGELYSHCSRLIANGHAPGAVNAFIRDYKIKKSWE